MLFLFTPPLGPRTAAVRYARVGRIATSSIEVFGSSVCVGVAVAVLVTVATIPPLLLIAYECSLERTTEEVLLGEGGWLNKWNRTPSSHVAVIA